VYGERVLRASPKTQVTGDRAGTGGFESVEGKQVDTDVTPDCPGGADLARGVEGEPVKREQSDETLVLCVVPNPALGGFRKPALDEVGVVTRRRLETPQDVGPSSHISEPRG